MDDRIRARKLLRQLNQVPGACWLAGVPLAPIRCVPQACIAPAPPTAAQELEYDDTEGRLAVLRQLLGGFDEGAWRPAALAPWRRAVPTAPA